MSLDDLEGYTFFDPKDVLVLHDHDWNVISYGVPEEPEDVKYDPERDGPLDPVAVAKAELHDGDPLPQPKHTPNPSTCLACEWRDLKAKIADAQ